MAEQAAPTVEVTGGSLRGRADGAVLAFTGVPYAATTAGSGRFRPPRPVEPWTGVRDATQFGPISPQPGAAGVADPEIAALLGGGDPREVSQGEDCLVLNVWTPATDDARRPVMLWLHGGGYVFGMGTAPGDRASSHGAALAAEHDVVVVTINHRLGIVGFLRVEEVLGDDYAGSANVGMLDAVAALEWVRDNIAALGGDPDNVTIFGQSGGGGKVNALMAMPAARGLFHRAICMSGTAGAGTVDAAAAVTEKVLDHLGLDRASASKLLELPVEQLVEAQMAVANMSSFNPVVDGVALFQVPSDAMATGDAADVPYLIGWTKDEWRLLGSADAELDEDGLRDALRPDLGDRIDAVLSAYRANRPGATPGELLVDLHGDLMFRRASTAVAETRVAVAKSPTWVYAFHYETPVLEGRLGSPHALDISFVFRTIDRVPLTGDRDDRYPLMDAMSAAWTTFARTGNPASAAIPEWPVYDLTDRPTMVFDAPVHLEHDPRSEERVSWT